MNLHAFDVLDVLVRVFVSSTTLLWIDDLGWTKGGVACAGPLSGGSCLTSLGWKDGVGSRLLCHWTSSSRFDEML